MTTIPTSFSVFVSSDPQYPWYDKVFPENLPEDQNNANAERQIQQQYHDMNHFRHERNESAFPVQAMLVNGDLTAFGHDWQLKKYRELLGILQMPVYPGLGNHDYANNVNNCHDDCAARMVEFMYDWLKLHSAELNYDFAEHESYKGELRTYYHGSLAYSFNLGRVHFVQLQNFPSYTVEWNSWDFLSARRKFFAIRPSFDWLENDLAIARNRGDAILVNLHDYNEHFAEADRKRFGAILRKYGVAALFGGHIHPHCGRIDGTDAPVPFFRSGAAPYQDYLVLDINVAAGTMDVHKRQDTTLAGEYKMTGDKWSVPLPMTVPNPPLPVPSKEGHVTFFNEGGFSARFSLAYSYLGETQTFSTGDMALGNKVTYQIPAGATDVHVKGEEHTGLAWEGWRTVFDLTFPSAPNNCFKLFGTTLHPNWNNNCK